MKIIKRADSRIFMASYPIDVAFMWACGATALCALPVCNDAAEYFR